MFGAPIYGGGFGNFGPGQQDYLGADSYKLRAEMLRRHAADQQARQAPPPPPRSRFDTPDVIDMVQDSEGVWRVPPQLEHRARER